MQVGRRQGQVDGDHRRVERHGRLAPIDLHLLGGGQAFTRDLELEVGERLGLAGQAQPRGDLGLAEQLLLGERERR